MESGVLKFTTNYLCVGLIVFLQVLALTRSASLANCGNLQHGNIIPSIDKENEFYECFNGSLILRTCPQGLVLDPASLYCINPCAMYDPLPYVTRYYVASPSSESSYYICPFNGTLSRQQCPLGTQFYQALGSLSANVCLRQSDLDQNCAGNSYVGMPLQPDNSCSTISLTPYYILCNNGMANIQRCPLNWVYSRDGYCARLNGNYCGQAGGFSNVEKCVCG